MDEKIDIKVEDLQSIELKAQKVFISGLKKQSEILDLFKQKLIILKNNDEQFKNNSEKNALNDLILFLQSSIDKDIKLDTEALNSFVNSWYFKTSKIVDWDPMMYKFLLYSLELDFEKFKESQNNNNFVALGTDCECNISADGILIKDCAGPEATCKYKQNCEGGIGCGVFWGDDCNGYCFVGDEVPHT